MRKRSLEDRIFGVGEVFLDFAAMAALLIVMNIHPTWEMVIWLVAAGFSLIVIGALVYATRNVIREVREGRLRND